MNTSIAHRPAPALHGRRAFSLVEMLVALAIFLVLLAAAFVPIKLAGDLSGVATARAGAQQSAFDGIVQIKRDIKRAIIILPNAQIRNVTDQEPYLSNGLLPYLRDSTSMGSGDACRTGTDPIDNTKAAVVAAANTSRLDLILPNEDNGSADVNGRASNVLVSYYCRRRDMTKPFDPINNPIVLYRAQVPYRVSYLNTTTNLFETQAFKAPDQPSAFNADLSEGRFGKRTPASSCTSDTSRGLRWLTMNQYGEFDLAPLCLPPSSSGPISGSAPPTFGAHTLVLPSDTALITPYANTGSYVPDVTFSLSSTGTKGSKIDRVTIQLSVGQYDANSVNRRDANKTGGQALQPQFARTLTDKVDAPNIK